MAFETITFEKMDGVGIITMNRPESRNALIMQMVAEMGEAIEACNMSDVRAVLLTGSGGGFCSGADLKFLLETSGSDDPKNCKSTSEIWPTNCITRWSWGCGGWRNRWWPASTVLPQARASA